MQDCHSDLEPPDPQVKTPEAGQGPSAQGLHTPPGGRFRTRAVWRRKPSTTRGPLAGTWVEEGGLTSLSGLKEGPGGPGGPWGPGGPLGPTPGSPWEQKTPVTPGFTAPPRVAPAPRPAGYLSPSRPWGPCLPGFLGSPAARCPPGSQKPEGSVRSRPCAHHRPSHHRHAALCLRRWGCHGGRGGAPPTSEMRGCHQGAAACRGDLGVPGTPGRRVAPCLSRVLRER